MQTCECDGKARQFHQDCTNNTTCRFTNIQDFIQPDSLKKMLAVKAKKDGKRFEEWLKISRAAPVAEEAFCCEHMKKTLANMLGNLLLSHILLVKICKYIYIYTSRPPVEPLYSMCEPFFLAYMFFFPSHCESEVPYPTYVWRSWRLNALLLQQSWELREAGRGSCIAPLHLDAGPILSWNTTHSTRERSRLCLRQTLQRGGILRL